MPREVFLPPDGSPFLHNAPFQQPTNFADDSDMDTSMPGLSSRYFQHNTTNDNLNSSRGLAGLDDVSLGMDDDTSPMRFHESESDELLMGINGGEFLADDSAMGFDTPLVPKTVKTRSKLNQSTTVPPAVSEEPGPEVEQPVKAEKPKRKKSTRSRSSSPTKKQPTPESAPEVIEEAAFPRAPMETMVEEPEPEIEPEPVVKPRRTSPRKARTRPPSVVDPPPVFPSARSSVSPFVPASTPPAPEASSEPVAEPAPQPTEPEPEAEPVPAAKPKRNTRVVGRSKSKTRSKSARTEEAGNEGLENTEKESSPAVVEEAPAPAVQQALPPVAESAPPAVAMDKAKSPPAREPTPPKPAAASVRHSIATSQPPETHTRVQSGPAPFKFQTRPSIAKSRNKSMSFTPPSSSPPVSAAAPSIDVYEDASTPKEEHREPTKEEEAEAVAAAMRILRRDSLVFPRPGQPYSFNLLNEPIQNDNEPASAPASDEPAQADSVPKRTRVGRRSTRVRGGAGIVTGSRSAVDEKIEEEGQDVTPESNAPAVEEVVHEPAAPIVEEAVHVEVHPEAGDINEDVSMDEDEPEAMEDVVVPVNFGSRSPSPAPAEPAVPAPAKEEVPVPPAVGPTPEVSLLKAAGAPTKTRATRASLPAQTARAAPPATRSSRRSEGRPVVTRTGSGMGPSRQKKDVIVEEKDEEEEVPKEETATEDNATEVVEPAAPVEVAEPAEEAPAPTESLETELEPEAEPVEDVAKPATKKAGAQQKGLGVSAAKGPQRTSQRSATTSSQGTTSTGPQRAGARAPRVASDSQKPPSGKPASATSAPMRATASAPLRTAPAKPAAPSSGSGSTAVPTSRPQRVASLQKPNSATTTSQKPSSSTSQKPASTTAASQKPGAPARVAVSKAKPASGKEPSPVIGKEPQAGPSKAAADDTPNAGTGVRATRALPKRAARMSKEQKAASSENSAEVVSTQPTEETEMEVTNDEIAIDEQPKPELPKPSPSNNLAWLNAATESSLNQPDTSNASTSQDVQTSNPFNSNKRRASTPEPDVDADAFESPSKRVRFSANLEAGPTPGPVRVANQRQPRSSLKVKTIAKPKFQLKAGRPKPKRTLTRDKAPSVMPSYAAPLKRTVSEKVETEAADLEKQRSPLTESQTNTRPAVDKPKPTVPVAFTFRSELRLKPHVPEAPLPAAIPIALPMPDFAAAHAAAEAANLARRERAQAAFLEAQAALESWRQSKHEIGSETARRAAERAVFDAAMRVKEAEAERVRVEARRLEEEREAIEIKEMRKRMVPKANPIPEFYKHLSQGEGGAGEEVEA